MTVQRSFFNWASSGLPYDRAPWESCSPNLLALLEYLVGRWGGYSLGCEADRPIRQGTAISSHAYGAALDWRYTPVLAGQRDVPRTVVLTQVLPFVIDWSAELQIDAIHDYFGDRIWRAGRTGDVAQAHGSWWKVQNGAGSGMGESWATYFHFETTRDGWSDATPIAQRIVTTPPPIERPTFQEETMLRAAKLNTNGSFWIGDGTRRHHVGGDAIESKLIAAAGLIDVATQRVVNHWSNVGTVDQAMLDRYVGTLS